jgi:cytochrome P450
MNQPDPQRLVEDFDHYSPELFEAIPEIFPALHKCPVMHSDKHGGYYVVSRRADVAKVARDHETFTSANEVGEGPGGGILIPPSTVRLGFLEMDPPDHSLLRKVVTKWFAPSAVDRYGERLRKLIRTQIEAVKDMGDFDVIDDLANPITAMSTIEYLGLPIDDWKIYLKPVHDQAIHGPDSPEYPQLLADIVYAQGKLRETIVERRSDPQDDLISRYTQTPLSNGEMATDDQILDVIWMIFGGGFDTTSSAMSHLLRFLSDNPDRRRELIERPELIPTAADEFVRYFAPAAFTGRTVGMETELNGVELKTGERLLVSWAAANFDEDEFDDPYELQFDRKPNRHLSYGDGIHRCLGARYAQLELEIFLEEVLRAMPAFVVHSDRRVPFPSVSVVNGYVHLPASANGSHASSDEVEDSAGTGVR